MAFPRALLADHEKVVFDLRPHWVALIPSILWSLLFVILAVLATRFNIVYNDDGTYQWWEIGLSVLLVGGWVELAVIPALRWQFTMFVLTSDRLITRQGIIAKHSKEIPLERINDVAFSQSVLERVLGAGDLLVESAGERGQTRIANVRKPEQVQLMIYKETESNTGRMFAGARDTVEETSIPEQIEALARLKEQGAITAAEFESKKQELLKRL
ncbi:MAG TPA: PH domain-containing protein [Actinomycetota bacterium]|nr:PH domain-containing protein [Actinomycetota bacterium]